MNLCAILPEISSLNMKDLTNFVQKQCHSLQNHFPRDVTNLISSFVGKLQWLEKLEGLTMKNMKTFAEAHGCKTYTNKRPTWNAQISAYTLEFT
eukprot:UN10625